MGYDGSISLESVKLPDGRIVTLTPYQEFLGPHELGESPSESDYWIEFRNPDNGEPCVGMDIAIPRAGRAPLSGGRCAVTAPTLDN